MAKPTAIRGLTHGTSLERAGQRILATRASDVERFASALPAAEPVHAMRVASRRLRVALRLFGLRSLDAQVKKLQDALGELRDLQIQDAWLALRDPALQHERAPLAGTAVRKLEGAAKEWQSRTMPSLLSAGLPLRGKLGGHRVRKRLRKALRKFEARRAAAAESLAPKETHLLRIAAKRLRYLCELLSPALEVAASLLDELSPVQQALGDLHDSDVRVELLRRHDRAMLLREEQADRERLAALVSKELRRWSHRRLTRRSLRQLR
jgi:CHAD domain-containing protein